MKLNSEKLLFGVLFKPTGIENPKPFVNTGSSFLQSLQITDYYNKTPQKKI